MRAWCSVVAERQILPIWDLLCDSLYRNLLAYDSSRKRAWYLLVAEKQILLLGHKGILWERHDAGVVQASFSAEDMFACLLVLKCDRCCGVIDAVA